MAGVYRSALTVIERHAATLLARDTVQVRVFSGDGLSLATVGLATGAPAARFRLPIERLTAPREVTVALPGRPGAGATARLDRIRDRLRVVVSAALRAMGEGALRPGP